MTLPSRHMIAGGVLFVVLAVLPQLPLADAHAPGQCRQGLIGEHALVDQLQCACHYFIANQFRLLLCSVA